MTQPPARRRGWRGIARIPQSLGARLVLILTGIGLAGSLAITLLLALVIVPSFDRLEEEAVRAHVDRTHAAIDEYARKMESAVRDYGDWNASYDYMAHPTRTFEEESFSTLAMANLDLAGMAYVTGDGRVLIARWIDVAGRHDEPALRSELIAAIPAMHLPTLLARRSSRGFYIRVGDRLAVVGAAQVRRSDGTGTPRGYVLMARELGSARLATLLQLPAVVDLKQPPIDRVTIAPGPRTLAIGVPIVGSDGRAVASTRYSVPRDLSLLGQRMLLLAVVGTIVLLAIVLIVLRRMIALLVLRPLHRVERHMGMVRASGALGVLPESGRGDEIGSLVTSFNSMLRQLKDLREQVEVQSFKLGQSESAVAVMHNVRNALNPISTILSQGQTAAPADRATIDRAIAELGADDTAPARRQKLAAFVAAAIAAEGDARTDRARQMETGRKALRNVLEIIGQQQEQAHEKPPLATIDVSEIVAQNAAIAGYAGGTSIAFAFPSRPHWCQANRVILSQVIGNLFANAAEAIAARGGEGGSITVTITQSDDRVEVSIRDNGEGFDPADEARLFQRGFSTRAQKSGGLGLHWCANSMVAMGGALRLESDGRGVGARAVLTLQAAPAEAIANGLAA
ncbi:ATP-binding protein [Sphingomonas sp.]|uniref:ATP-binding protein n=1 Tax=Sphingomonas sp. TaxID=28214 RepID=UPI002B7F3366|nr:CHASE4 domain-containing protein [Sphingomonas sp.]HWK36429.1 CHASE4 domain-containing protein [Sphingomonas sp.]